MKYISLTVLLLVCSTSLADTSRAHMKALDEDLRRLTQQLASIDGQPPGMRVAEHLQELEAHLQRTRREICGDCASDDVARSAFGREAAACGDATGVGSAMTRDEYAALMRRELPQLHDSLHRLTRERFLFEPRTVHERQRLLRQYYDRVLRTIDAAGPSCGSGLLCRTTHVDRYLQTPVVGSITTGERAIPQNGAPTRTRAPLVCEHEAFVAPG
jgi:hypothetical protein